MSFQYLLYLKLDRSEENVFWHSNDFIIFEALISCLEHKGRLIFKNWLRLTLMTLMERNEKIAAEMLIRDIVVAFTYDPNSRESFYLIKITKEEKEKMGDVEDGFGHVIKKGMKHLEGKHLRKEFWLWQSLHNT